ncbi:MAG: hypothetical protein Kow0092_09310 [Deferrisomatales bacterium]
MTSRSLIPRERGLDLFPDIGREVEWLTSEMERMFDELMGPAYEPRLFRFRPAWSGVAHRPTCDVSEKENEYVLRAEVPGFTKDQIHVDVTENSVTLRGEYKQAETEEHERYLCRESRLGTFERTFRFDTEINTEGVQAKLKDGVLTLVLPKVRSEQIKHVEVKEEA